MWIRVGASIDAGLPRDVLTDEERGELRRMLEGREASRAQVALFEQQLQLLLLNARDRRGLSGVLRVDPETGALTAGEGDDE